MPLLIAKKLGVTRFSHGGANVVLQSGSFELPRGKLLDIEGVSGAGKSSLLSAIAMLIPFSGKLALGGVDSAAFSPLEWRTRVSLVPQKPVMFTGSVKENLLAAWSFKVNTSSLPKDGDLLEALCGLGLNGVSLKCDASRLSVGQMARVAFLRVLLYSPQVMLLDEVSSSLDSEASRLLDGKILDYIKEGNSVIRVCHHEKYIEPDLKLLLKDGILN